MIRVIASDFGPIVIDEDPGTFHARPFTGARSLWIPKLTPQRTLVLGSSQKSTAIDADALTQRGISLASRRSGGGAVLVSSDDLVWFDVVLGSDDPLFVRDVGRSFDWIGQVCQRALASLGAQTTMHTGRLEHSRWSRDVCFAGRGPGELMLDGRKVVGMSQRRTRDAARIQVAILRRWDGELHASLLARPADVREQAAAELINAATGIPHAGDDILTAVYAELRHLT
jgi:lipoate-protein ligase A